MPQARKRTVAGRGAVLALLLLLVLLSLAPAPVLGETLVATSAHLPEGLIQAGVAWDGHQAYLFGGRNATSLQDSILAYDPATGHVTTLPSKLPSAMQSLTAVATPAGPLAFGGAHVVAEVTPTGSVQAVIRPSDRVLKLDPASGSLATMPDHLPKGAFAMGGVWTGQAVYLFGGLNTTRTTTGAPNYVTLDRILRYDPAAPAGHRITTLPVHLPAPMRDLSTAWSGRYVYLFGGVVEEPTPNGSATVPSDRILRFDPATENLTVLPTRLPTSLRWNGIAVAGTDAYLVGGCRRACNITRNDTLDSILRFNFTTETVTTLPVTLPSPLLSPMVFYDGSLVQILGGRGPRSINDARATIERLAPGATPPGAPATFSAEAQGTGVALTWSPPTDDGGARIAQYEVQRATGTSALQTVLTVPGNRTAIVDSGARAGVMLQYRIVAVGPGGPGAPSVTRTVSIPAHAPAPPAALEALGYDGGIVVRWSPPADDGGARITGYRVTRSDGGAVTVHATSYLDHPVSWGTNVTYQVEALNSAGASAAAGPVTAHPTSRLAPPGNLTLTPGNGSITLRWDPPTGAVQGYIVRRGNDPGNLTTSKAVSGTSYVDDGLPQGRVYWYQVVAVNASGGEGVPSRTLRGAILAPPGPVRDLTVALVGRNATLRWSPPSNAGGAPTVYFLVSRQGPGDAAPQTIQPDYYTATSFVDPGLQANATYRYWVETVNAAGRGPSVGPLKLPVPAPHRPPVANATLSAASVVAGHRVTLDASASRAPDGSVAALQVDWGDGGLTPWQGSLTASHAYASVGNYTVSALVEDDAGATSPAPALLHVQVTKPASNVHGPTGTGTVEPGSGSSGGGNHVPAPGALVLVSLLGAAALAWRRR